jgi:hypothetical protein
MCITKDEYISNPLKTNLGVKHDKDLSLLKGPERRA